MHLTRLEFGSLLSYTPRGSSDEIQKARDVMLTIKSDGFIDQPPIQMSHWIGSTIQKNVKSLPFASFFDQETSLVPVPRSSLMKPDTLWVPDRIASALVEKRLGKEVVQCLVRETPVPKAAWSDSSERPTPSRHFETIAVQGSIEDPPPQKLVLVDDIVTRGATLLGSANRLLEAFPKARVRAFAAMRTISVPSEFVNLYDPQSGTIEYRAWIDDTLRRP